MAIVGRPNAGKSTLFNALLGTRLSAITHKPQTTRHNIRGILTLQDTQIIFVDTPGIHGNHKRLLNHVLNRNVQAALIEVDLIIFVTDKSSFDSDEHSILDLAANDGTPVLLCLNKVDRIRDKQTLLPILSALKTVYSFDEIIPVSALKGDNLDALTTSIRTHLPAAEFIFPEDQITDRSERFVASELIREKILLNLNQEVPYAVYVQIEKFEDTKNLATLSALIWVERETQKRILIGRQGEMLKRIGTQARHAIESFLDKKVMLRLWVKVKPGWQDEPSIVAEFER